MQRRHFLASGAALLVQYLISPALASGLSQSVRNTVAFDAVSPESVYAALGIEPPEESSEILIDAPDLAENGAKVPVEILARLPDVERILLIAELNRYPLLADISLTPRMRPWFEARVRLAETSTLRAIAESRGKLYTASKRVRVILGGCPG